MDFVLLAWLRGRRPLIDLGEPVQMFCAATARMAAARAVLWATSLVRVQGAPCRQPPLAPVLPNSWKHAGVVVESDVSKTPKRRMLAPTACIRVCIYPSMRTSYTSPRRKGGGGTLGVGQCEEGGGCQDGPRQRHPLRQGRQQEAPEDDLLPHRRADSHDHQVHRVGALRPGWGVWRQRTAASAARL